MLHKAQLEQIRKQVKSELPLALYQMDPVLQEYVFNMSFTNKLLLLRIEVLETNIDKLLNWHHGELKRLRTDSSGETHFFERFHYGSKTDVDFIKLPRILSKEDKKFC